MNRRTFLKAAAVAAVPTPVALASYGMFEAGWLKVERPVLPLPHLPRSFDGLRVAFLSDIHHGPYTQIDYLTSIVRTTLALKPELILLGGGYTYQGSQYVAPCFEALAALSAPLGVFAVLGNHDYSSGLIATQQAMFAAGITELTNRGIWLERGAARLRLGGVDDLWFGQPDAGKAVGDAKPEDAVLLVSHNPDFAERLRDSRVGLMLSGHTHGGQAVAPVAGAPFVPSRYGEKYLKGRVQAPTTTVYVSRGLGTVVSPMRFGSRPELTLLTLRTA